MKKRFVCIVLTVVLAALLLSACGGPKLVPPREEIPTQILGTVLQEFVYTDTNGYYIPAARRVARTDDPTALMRRLCNDEPNLRFLAETGLHAPLPQGFDVSAAVNAGEAVIDIKGDWSTLTDAQERTLVRCVVGTGLMLPGADSVRLTFNGTRVLHLTHGTNVNGPFRNMSLNVDTSQYDDVGRGTPVILYFGAPESDLLVPVSRFLQNPPTLQVAISQLCRGPSNNSALNSLFPEGTVIRYCELVDGVATVDFSSEFVSAMGQDDGGMQCIRSIMLTCAQFQNVDRVHLRVEGEALEAMDWNMAAVTFANEFGE
ncbi:MAG: GerMN domain-containing protein [Clostridia bacterium]|nr:GerMN domain-containing protein [Clostridia bacterium]